MIGSTVEFSALAWLESPGWAVKHGPDIGPVLLAAERRDYGEVVLGTSLRDALLSKLISGDLWVKDAEKFLESREL